MQNTTGHIITVPAHLIPFMDIDLNMDAIHSVNHDDTKGALTIVGYNTDDDGEISSIRWQTWNGTLRTITDETAPDAQIDVWVPSIPAALAAELA